MPANSTKAPARFACAELDELVRVFGRAFSVFDIETGEAKPTREAGPLSAWSEEFTDLASLSDAAVPQIAYAAGPLAIMAIPLPRWLDSKCVAATAVYLDGHPAGVNGWGPQWQDVFLWAQQRDGWSAAVLLQMATLLVEKWAAGHQADCSRREVEDITTHMLGTYEELSLLHRLTQNLTLSSTEIELGEQAIGWLSEVIPAQGIAIYMNPIDQPGQLEHVTRNEGTLRTFGDCPLDQDQFEEFIADTTNHSRTAPTVLNRNVTQRASWAYPGVREVTYAPLAEGSTIFGWLLAFNHNAGREFGTVEASLMGSVATILGIHAGNISLYREQAELLAGVVRALTSAIDAKDPYTCGHSDRVARVSVRLAEELGCDSASLHTIYLSGLLHDVGKIGIDDNVLRKPGRLTAAEFEHIKLHPSLGHKILQGLKQLEHVLPVVLHHHEAVDGSGYPNGLAGEEIPLLARIVAVADSFDAMSSDRPYRQGMPREKLEAIFREGAGRQWDAEVVDAYFRAEHDILAIADEPANALAIDTQLLV